MDLGRTLHADPTLYDRTTLQLTDPTTAPISIVVSDSPRNLDPAVDHTAIALHVAGGASRSASAQSSAKRWCFTLNNYVPLDYFNHPDLLDHDIYDYLIYGHEVAASGTPHLQGYVCFKTPQRMSSLKKILARASWRVAGGTPQQNKEYCSKGEQSKEEWEAFKTQGPNYGLNANVVERGNITDLARSGVSKGGKAPSPHWFEARDATSYDEALAIVLAADPKNMILHGKDIRMNLATLHAPKIAYRVRYKLEQFCHPPLSFSLDKVTLVYGNTGTGKTSFVKAHFNNPLFVRHPDILKEYRPRTFDAIIFDDYSFNHWPISSVIFLLDCKDVSHIHVRYSVVTLQPADEDNCPRIFIHNLRNPFYSEETPEEQKAAVERRINRVHIVNNLYK